MASADRSQLVDVFSKHAKRYDTTVQYFTPLATDLISRAGVHTGQDVLDIGCGRGAVTFQAAVAVGPSGSVKAIDIAPGMVEACADDVREQGLTNVAVSLQDGVAPDFPASSFDHVLGSMSIIMIPDLMAALRNYRILLRDGGTVGITAPAMGPDPLDWRIGPFHLRRFLADALPDLSPAELAPMVANFHRMEPHRLLGDLRAAGFREPRAVDVITVVSGSAEDLVAWTFTHGTRVFWDLVPEPRKSEYAAEWVARIEAEFAGRQPAFETVSRIFLANK